jgi:hypothetical protein
VTTKSAPKWAGPYRIHEVDSEQGVYRLAELDGAVINKKVAGHRLKIFYPPVDEPPLDGIDPLESVFRETTPTLGEEEEEAVEEEEREEGIGIDAVNPADDVDEWAVKGILDHRPGRGRPRAKGGKLMYLIDWKSIGGHPWDPTWEPEKNLIHSLGLLNDYQRSNGLPLTRYMRQSNNGEE